MQWKYILRCIGVSLFRSFIRKQWSDRGQRTKGQQCRLVLSPNHGSVLCAALVMKWSFINPQRTCWFCSKAVTEQDGEGVMVTCNESGLKPGSSPYPTAKYGGVVVLRPSGSSHKHNYQYYFAGYISYNNY